MEGFEYICTFYLSSSRTNIWIYSYLILSAESARKTNKPIHVSYHVLFVYVVWTSCTCLTISFFLL